MHKDVTHPASGLSSTIRFLLDNSVLLFVGAGAGLLWANLDHRSYESLLHLKLLANHYVGRLSDGGSRLIDLHFLVNDVLMAFFFAIAGKEVWSAVLPGGPLHEVRKAATPLLCAVGGMLAPALLYLAGVFAVGRWTELNNGWAIPCATDIAFSYLIARLIFGRTHPAITFLLMLAIVDDALGMAILAVFYPQEPVRWVWLLLPAGAVATGLVFQRLRLHHFGWYLMIPGAASWLGFALAGLHPALGLLPIIPMIPHASVNKAHVGWDVVRLADRRNQFEHWLKNPVEVVLGLFALFNAGVSLGNMGAATYLVIFGLLLGKPLGIFLTGTISVRLLGMGLPQGLTFRHLLVLGCIAGIGFTVAIFVATVAFPPGQVQDAAKMGALASFAAAFVGWGLARVLNLHHRPEGQPH